MPFWSVNKFTSIVQVEIDPETYSYDAKPSGINITDRNARRQRHRRANPSEAASWRYGGLIPVMVEIIRRQAPIVRMRPTVRVDTKKRIGDKVVMWSISGNRDEDAINNPNNFIIDHARPRHHLSFGFGLQRRVGNRLAEMQLTNRWEEIMARFPVIELIEGPKRI